MIDSNELRKGGVVRYYGDTKPLIIKHINTEPKGLWKGGHVLLSNKSRVAMSALDPIPLDKDWLLNIFVGFEMVTDTEYDLKLSEFRTIRVMIPDNGHSIPHLWIKDTHGTVSGEFVFVSHPKYVHQLQNICYILKQGKELEYK